MLTQKKRRDNLKHVRKGLADKVGELKTAKAKLDQLQRQRVTASESFDRLDHLGGADPGSVSRLRALSDQVERCEQCVAQFEDVTIPKLEADLRLLLGVASERYQEAIAPRIDRIEKQIREFLKPMFFTEAKAIHLAASCDCVCYLRTHANAQWPEGGDIGATVSWVIARLDLLSSDPDVLPWGKNRPPAFDTRPAESAELQAA